MPIYRDHYTRGSEIKATARSEKLSLTSGLLYGDFHFFTPVCCLPSEKITDHIPKTLGRSFRFRVSQQLHFFHLLCLEINVFLNYERSIAHRPSQICHNESEIKDPRRLLTGDDISKVIEMIIIHNIKSCNRNSDY